MKRRLYEVKTFRETIFDRKQAAAYYNQIMRSRKAFALAINSMLIQGQKGKGYAPPYAAQNLREQLKGWKDQYNQMYDIPVYTVITRRYHGQRIEEVVNIRNMKRDARTGRVLNPHVTTSDRKRALVRVIEKLQEIRRHEKYISCPILNKITNRKPNGMLHEFQSKRLRLPKRPTDGADYIGIEIESILPSGVDYTPLYPFAKWVEIGGDGSIDHHGGEEGVEFKVCVKREEVREVLPRLMATLKEMGARVNKSCGLHVHLDQRNNQEPDKVFQKLVRSLGLLYTVVPESRRRNRYCKRNRHSDFMAAQRGERYKAVNASAFSRYRTIEVRLFGGTLEATKIINWIEVLLAIAYGETVMRCPKTFDTSMRYWKLSAENLAWLKERQTKFSVLNTGMPVSEHETEANQMLLDETQPDPDEEETCGECENALDDCSCNSECECGDCEQCNERQEDEERASRARAARQRAAEAADLERRRALEARQNITIQPIDLSSYDMWRGMMSNEVPPVQPVLNYETMQRAVDQLTNQHIESMQSNMYNAVFLNDSVWVANAAEPEQPPVTPPTENPPESNGEVPF